MDSNSSDRLRPASWVVSAGRDRHPGAALNVPLVPASNFVLGGQRAYSRDDSTPTWEALEEVVGGLENGLAVAFASGMAAVAAVFDQLAAGARVALPTDCYSGAVALARAGEARGRWSVARIAIDDTEAWLRACESADLIWLESPSNPLLEIGDLPRICAAPRRPGAIVAVDNTFATPLNQRPLQLGADVSIQSATKFIGGHSDLLAGVATAATPALRASLVEARSHGGGTPGTLEAFLALRGVRTMAVRLERAQENAMEIASRLEAHPNVAVVRYPGLRSHPGHELARRQLDGFGSIISFDVRGGGAEADAVCRAVRLVEHATSLGGVESTMERRAVIPGQEHLPPSLIRLSVGIEDVNDIWADLDQALNSVTRSQRS
ncbi:MAG TPA: PLP-dependent transferase [Longimicrobium sp.]|nr:PLP-dependent transferase [Longimicrobium sp.]